METHSETATPSTERTMSSENRKPESKTFGIANSFSDSEKQRNRKPTIAPQQSSPSTATPTPLPKRPKGRWFVGTFLLSLIGLTLYSLWSAYFSVSAYGLIEGRKRDISSTEAGVIEIIHVHEGELVYQGAPLITLKRLNVPEPDQSAEDQLRAALYDFEIEVARVRIQSSIRSDSKARAMAEYYQLWGDYLQEESRLDELIDKFRRTQQLSQRNSIGSAGLRTSELDVKGQRDKVAKLKLAVEKMGQAANDSGQSVDFTDLANAHQNRIMALREKVRQQQSEPLELVIRAPVTGKVVRILHHSGEVIQTGKPMLEIVESGSIRPVLYVQQSQASEFTPGKQSTLLVAATQTLVPCVVDRVGDEFVTVPDGLKAQLLKPFSLIPVYFQPLQADVVRRHMRLGTRIELPRPLSWKSLMATSMELPDAEHEPTSDPLAAGSEGEMPQTVHETAHTPGPPLMPDQREKPKP